MHDRFKNKQLVLTAVDTARKTYTSANTAIQTPKIERRLLEEYQIHDAFRKFKYIVVNHPDLGEVALCFPGFLVHREMYRQVFPRSCQIIAAGFYDIYPDTSVKAYGKSESLSIESRPEKDSFLIQRSLGLC